MGNFSPDLWRELVEDARRYPSPHNSQPIKLRVLDQSTAEIFYDLDRGLPAESYGIPFGHVCAGVFLESLSVVARARGYRTVENLDHAEFDFTATDRLHRLGKITLEQVTQAPEERERALAELANFLSRQTSRLPYDRSPISPDVIAGATEIGLSLGHNFHTTADRPTVANLVRINQVTLFSDLQNAKVHAEILHWLRFSRREALERSDGLSAETMLMPGPVLKFAMSHRRLWTFPVIGAVIRGVYLRTMRGVRMVAWLEGPFASPADFVVGGRTFMRIWLYLSAQGVQLHPFGSVITNPDSHREFVEAVGTREVDGQMAWMLFRLGHSATAPQAHRRPAREMLLSEAPLPDNIQSATPLTESEIV